MTCPRARPGEEWEVHGGGFYHTTKYLVAPARLPEHLTWHKWQSYWTWLSGAALLMLVYWSGAEMFLIDYDKIEWAPWQAIAISAGSLAIGWILYDALCKSRLGERPTVLMLLLFAILVGMSWGYNEVFTGRAALLHLGAFTATIMTANVFFIIMPNQRIVVKDLKEGRTPDAKYGKIAKLRSTHNNYLTLPVIFLMLSNHYPLAFATEYNWIIASLVFLMGVTIRHYFNSMHAGKGQPHWTWGATAIIFIVIMWLSSTRCSRITTGRKRCRSRRIWNMSWPPPSLTRCAMSWPGAARCATTPSRHGTGCCGRRKLCAWIMTPKSPNMRARFICIRGAATRCLRGTLRSWSLRSVR